MGEEKKYDVIIAGGGPAGMAAAIYAARGNLKTLLIEKSIPGGQMMKTDLIENYPGFPSVHGPDLAKEMSVHVTKFGAEIMKDTILKIKDGTPAKEVITKNGMYRAKAVIIATGAEHRKLGVPGESKFIGGGVSYCAVCDAAFFSDLELVVVGGGDSAVEEAIYLTNFASKVTIIHRRDALRAQAIIQRRAQENKKIEFIWNSTVEEIFGEGIVKGVRIRNKITGEMNEYPCDGIFIFVGLTPLTECVKELGITDGAGYILTDENMQTSIPGIFAAGDVRAKKLRQVVTATGDGSIAAQFAQKYIEFMGE